MTNKLQCFAYDDKVVRTVEKNGEPWWVLRDVCAVLELTTPARVAERLEEDEVSQTHLIDSIGRRQETTLISECGLYNVILRSDKPEAKRFRRWITHEILPELRKNGVYAMPNTTVQHKVDDQLQGIICELDNVMHSLSSYLQKKENCTFPIEESDVFAEADKCRGIMNNKKGGIRNRTRVKTSIEANGYIPFVVLYLKDHMTYEQIAERMREMGFAVSKSAVGRFRQSLECAKIDGGQLYVAMKNGCAYQYDIETLDMLGSKGCY